MHESVEVYQLAITNYQLLFVMSSAVETSYYQLTPDSYRDIN